MIKQDLPNDQISASWIENLALEELNMDETGVVHFNEHLNPHAVLEETSLKFMDELRDHFEYYISKFNLHRGQNNSSSCIKIFKISNTVNDFMLFRNSLKLVVARKSNAVIHVGLLSNTGSHFPGQIGHNTPPTHLGHEIKAHIGPFNTISWHFQGEPFQLDPLVRHYLTEFVRNSAR